MPQATLLAAVAWLNVPSAVLCVAVALASLPEGGGFIQRGLAAFAHRRAVAGRGLGALADRHAVVARCLGEGAERRAGAEPLAVLLLPKAAVSVFDASLSWPTAVLSLAEAPRFARSPWRSRRSPAPPAPTPSHSLPVALLPSPPAADCRPEAVLEPPSATL